MLTNVCKGEHVPNVLGVCLRVDGVDLNPGDPRARVDHRQTLEGIVVLVPEILGQKISF